MEDDGYSNVLFPTLKQKIEELGFKFQGSNQNELIWGFDGVTKYYPEDIYVRESIDGKPSVSLKLKKTSSGITVILNSITFSERFHLDKAPLTEQEAIETVKNYIKLL